MNGWKERAKTRIAEEKSLAAVRQESGGILDFQRAGVSLDLSGMCTGCVDGQKH